VRTTRRHDRVTSVVAPGGQQQGLLGVLSAETTKDDAIVVNDDVTTERGTLMKYEMLRGDAGRTLVVVAGGFGESKMLFPGRKKKDLLDSLCVAVRDVDAEADVLKASFGWKGAYLWVDARDVVAELLHEIDAAWEEKKYEKIAFVGHSVGAVVLRKVLYVSSIGHFSSSLEEDEDEDRRSSSEAMIWRLRLAARPTLARARSSREPGEL